MKALASAVRPEALSLGEALVSIDLRNRVARTTKREVRFERLVSSAPFPKLAAMCGLAHDREAFTWNKVLVFNLGFDRKGERDVHWVYFPDRATSFYRIGFYDNIFDADRLSLYVELGFPRDAAVDVPAMRARVLDDLQRLGITTDHRLVAEHSVVMDPAYVHITTRSNAELARLRRVMQASGVYAIGRYGGWTYCSIEDNIVEAASALATLVGGTTGAATGRRSSGRERRTAQGTAVCAGTAVPITAVAPRTVMPTPPTPPGVPQLPGSSPATRPRARTSEAPRLAVGARR